MRKLLYAGLVITGILSVSAFSFSLYRSWQLPLLAREQAPLLFYHFSLYIPDTRNSFFNEIIRGAEIAAAELNYAISVHSIDPARNELENAAFSGVDGVIVYPHLDSALARRQMEQFRTQQIPAVLINQNLPSDQPWPFIGINNFELGRRIGHILSDSPDRIGLAVVYSEKAPGIYTERNLVEMGIATSLGELLSGSIMSFQTNFNPLDAEALLAAMFRNPISQERSLINTIIFTDPEDTIAAAQALVDLNLVGQLRIIGFGADPGVIENVQKGIISASVVIDSQRIGYEAVYSLAALLTTGFTSASTDIEIEIINRDLQ